MLQTKMLPVRLLHDKPNLPGPRSQERAFEYEKFPEILRAKEALQDDKVIHATQRSVRPTEPSMNRMAVSPLATTRG